jgi:hypothetical protein
MILSTLIIALVGKALAFLILGPVVIIALLAYIISSKARR